MVEPREQFKTELLLLMPVRIQNPVPYRSIDGADNSPDRVRASPFQSWLRIEARRIYHQPACVLYKPKRQGQQFLRISKQTT